MSLLVMNERSESSRLDRLAGGWDRYDPVLYAGFAMCCTIYAASAFYGYMLVQTQGVWSAPLDDTFIHFDYARSFARGFPFHWSEGNGYSSGNTSLSYPVALAFGYWIGFRKLSLATWAAVVAVVSVLGFLLCTGRLIDRGAHAEHDAPRPPRWMKYLVPPAVLSLGALDWTLFSGMENAFHLGAWGLCAAAVVRQIRQTDGRTALRAAWLTGAAGALLVSARPESGVCVAAFAFYTAYQHRRRGVLTGWDGTVRVLVAVGLPGVILLAIHAFANVALTGEWSASGSITKLFINNPFMSTSDKWERYSSLLAYIIPRLGNHHFGDPAPIGWLVPLLAVVPLADRRTRPVAVLLWVQIIAWLLLVSMNNQIRWHNERYAMPAVAWMMVLGALGVGVIATRRPWARKLWPAHALTALALTVIYWSAQAPRMRDQIWFYGRACRNILDQHVTAGMVIRKLKPRRVLVGDAGALTYASDRPGLDLIGLGGFLDYPFARSNVNGLGASLELIERMPDGDRPDLMAIYPSWWGDLPTYFGHHVVSVPVQGNVICGGAEKVLYRTDWTPLDRDGAPRTLQDGERVIDALDVADLLSEKAHDYNLPKPSVGFVNYKVLSDPAAPKRPLFDAGRVLPVGQVERARLKRPPNRGKLLVRVAPGVPTRVVVRVDGSSIGELTTAPKPRMWQEVSLPLDGGYGTMVVELESLAGAAVHYHLWVISEPWEPGAVQAKPATP